MKKLLMTFALAVIAASCTTKTATEACAEACATAEACETVCDTACAEACADEAKEECATEEACAEACADEAKEECATAEACETACDKIEALTFSVYRYDGRIYVISKPETIAAFKATGHMPFTKTFIGAGPNKETVVVEVDKDDKTLAETLWKAFNEK